MRETVTIIRCDTCRKEIDDKPPWTGTIKKPYDTHARTFELCSQCVTTSSVSNAYHKGQPEKF